jgi:hypothetical protein
LIGATEKPDPFLTVVVRSLDIDPDLQPPLTTVCAGYELDKWRAEQFAKHLVEWLPD